MSSHSPFSRQPFPSSGDTEPEIVYQAVGKALSHWEITEEDFAALFNTLITPLHMSFALKRSYGNIATARGRNEMIAAAAEIFFRNFPDAALQKDLKGHLKKYSEAGARRNELAHGIVAGHVWEATQPFTGNYLGPSLWNTNKRGSKLEPAYIYNSEMIFELAKQFLNLKYSTRGIMQRIAARFLAAPLEHQKRH